MTTPYEISNGRKADYEVNKIFTNRWSPRAMSGEPISDDNLNSLFEAARWAPSSSNIQPWRFLYAKKDSPEWDTFFNLLVEFNQMWCKNASALIVIISKNTNDKNEANSLHSFDTGAAWMNLSHQARLINLVCHGIGGFDYKKAKNDLKIPDGYTIEAMTAIGHPGEIEDLHERMQKSEKPNQRKATIEIFSKGLFPNNWI